MNNDQIKGLLNSIGSLAEIATLLYQASVNAGASDNEAERIVKAFFASIYSAPNNTSEE